MNDEVKSMVKKVLAFLVAAAIGWIGSKYLGPDFSLEVSKDIQQSAPAQSAVK